MEMAVQKRTSELEHLMTKKDVLLSEIDNLNKSKDKSQILLDKQHSEIQRLSSEINDKHIILKDIKNQ